MTQNSADINREIEASSSLDLTQDDPASSVSSVVIQFDPIREREQVRSAIAKGLIALLFIVVIFSFVLFYLTDKDADLKDLLVVIFPPLIGIIGTVLGFYFGAESAKSSNK